MFFAYAFFVLDKTIVTSYSYHENNIVINNVPIAIMIADEAAEHWQGLSDRDSMGPYNGMLFVFPNYQIRTFVMRNMRFPLDIIWIKNNEIIKIDKRLEPEKNKPVKRYSSSEPVNYVLEVNGGLSDAFGFQVGDKVEINYDK